jgi:hypothetical protein
MFALQLLPHHCICKPKPPDKLLMLKNSAMLRAFNALFNICTASLLPHHCVYKPKPPIDPLTLKNSVMLRAFNDLKLCSSAPFEHPTPIVQRCFNP